MESARRNRGKSFRGFDDPRVREKVDVFDFELTAEDMEQIEALDRELRVGPDPDAMIEKWK